MVELLLAADVGELPRLEELVRQAAARWPISSEAAFRLNVVLEEWFVNVVRHAGAGSGQLPIRVSLDLGDDGVIVEATDGGPPFDPTRRADPDVNAPLESRGAGGLGIYFIRQFTRNLTYRRVNGYNELSFVLPTA